MLDDELRQFEQAHRIMVSRRPLAWQQETAFSIWKDLVARQYVRSMFCLGICYDFGVGTREDSRRAFDLYGKAARAGHPEAQYTLHMMRRGSVGVGMDARLALRWVNRVAVGGDTAALRDLGYCYHKG